VPVISANTQVREEGYFRLEWKLAVDRWGAPMQPKPIRDGPGDEGFERAREAVARALAPESELAPVECG
jgi:hypothetical protein